MADINKVVLVGRLTRDAEQTYTPSGYALLKFGMAVNRRRKQGDEWVDEANFFDVTVFGRQGEAIARYMTKGKQVAVEGQLRQERWESQDGTRRSKVSIEANYVQMLGGRDDRDASTRPAASGGAGGGWQSGSWNEPPGGGAPNPAPAPGPGAQQAPAQPAGPAPAGFEDDIPF